MVLITAAGTIHLSIAAYRDFIESPRLLVEHFKTIIRRILDRTSAPFDVYGTLNLGPGIVAPEPYARLGDNLSTTYTLILY